MTAAMSSAEVKAEINFPLAAVVDPEVDFESSPDNLTTACVSFPTDFWPTDFEEPGVKLPQISLEALPPDAGSIIEVSIEIVLDPLRMDSGRSIGVLRTLKFLRKLPNLSVTATQGGQKVLLFSNSQAVVKQEEEDDTRHSPPKR